MADNLPIQLTHEQSRILRKQFREAVARLVAETVAGWLETGVVRSELERELGLELTRCGYRLTDGDPFPLAPEAEKVEPGASGRATEGMASPGGDVVPINGRKGEGL